MKFSTFEKMIVYKQCVYYIYEWEELKFAIFHRSLLSDLWLNSLALILIQFLSLSKRLDWLLFNILNYIT